MGKSRSTAQHHERTRKITPESLKGSGMLEDATIMISQQEEAEMHYLASLAHPEDITDARCPLILGGIPGPTVMAQTVQEVTFHANTTGFAFFQVFGPIGDALPDYLPPQNFRCYPTSVASTNWLASSTAGTYTTSPGSGTGVVNVNDGAVGSYVSSPMPGVGLDLANSNIRLVSAVVEVVPTGAALTATGQGMIGRAALFADTDAAENFGTFYAEPANERAVRPLPNWDGDSVFRAVYIPQRAGQFMFAGAVAGTANWLAGAPDQVVVGYPWAEFYADGCPAGLPFFARITCNWEVQSANFPMARGITMSDASVALVHDARPALPPVIHSGPTGESPGPVVKEVLEAVARPVVARNPPKRAWEKIKDFFKRVGPAILKAGSVAIPALLSAATSKKGQDMIKQIASIRPGGAQKLRRYELMSHRAPQLLMKSFAAAPTKSSKSEETPTCACVAK